MEQNDGPTRRSQRARDRARGSPEGVRARIAPSAPGFERQAGVRERRTLAARFSDRAQPRKRTLGVIVAAIPVRMRFSRMIDGHDIVRVLVIVMVVMIEQHMTLALVRVAPLSRRAAERERLQQRNEEHQDLAQTLGTRTHRWRQTRARTPLEARHTGAYRPPRALPGVAAWLRTRRGRRG